VKRKKLIIVLLVIIILVISIGMVLYLFIPKQEGLFVISSAYRAVSAPDLIIKEGFNYDIRAYGAVADDATTDMTAIQAALDSCNNDTGGTVFIPPGQWEMGFNDTLRIHSKTVIRGAGIGATKINYTKTTGDSSIGKAVFYVENDSDITFCDFEIDGNAAYVLGGAYGEYDAGIALGSASTTAKRITIERVYIHDTAGDGIEIRNADDVIISECTISTPNVRGANPLVGRNSISIQNCDNIKVINNTLLDGNPACIDVEPNATESVYNVHISGNYMEGTYRGVALEFGSAVNTERIHVTNNIFNTLEYGVISISASPVNYIDISNNTFTDCDYSIYGSSSSKLMLSNNKIYSNTNDAILFTTNNSNINIFNNVIYESGNQAINFDGTEGNENTQITIQNNTIFNNSQSDDSTYYGVILTRSDSLYIIGNYVYDDQSTPTQKGSFDFVYCDYLDVSFNYAYGNTGGDAPAGDIPLYFNCTNIRYGMNQWGNRLRFLFNYDQASMSLQSGDDSMWWISTDTTGSNDILMIGGDSTAIPDPSSFALKIDTDKGVSVTDSLKINSAGIYIRKIFLSAGGDSIGFIYYDSVDGAVDTVWASQ